MRFLGAPRYRDGFTVVIAALPWTTSTTSRHSSGDASPSPSGLPQVNRGHSFLETGWDDIPSKQDPPSSEFKATRGAGRSSKNIPGRMTTTLMQYNHILERKRISALETRMEYMERTKQRPGPLI